VQGKLCQMALLQEAAHATRMRFNARFLALRSLKREIVAGVCSDAKRVSSHMCCDTRVRYYRYYS
jgi:hypothetical protein